MVDLEDITSNNPTIFIYPQAKLQLKVDKENDKSAKFIEFRNFLLNDKRAKKYRMLKFFEYIEQLNTQDASQRIKPINANFHLEEFFSVYEIFFGYYKELYDLILNFYKPILEEYRSLQLQLGYDKEYINASEMQYIFNC